MFLKNGITLLGRSNTSLLLLQKDSNHPQLVLPNLAFYFPHHTVQFFILFGLLFYWLGLKYFYTNPKDSARVINIMGEPRFQHAMLKTLSRFGQNTLYILRTFLNLC